MTDIKEVLDSFLNKPSSTKKSIDSNEEEVCDLQTGECYTIRTVDGIVERLNKKYVTEDGRQLLQD